MIITLVSVSKSIIRVSDHSKLSTIIYLCFHIVLFVIYHLCHYSGWHRAPAGHQPYGALPPLTLVEAVSEKLWTGQVVFQNHPIILQFFYISRC